MAMFSKIISKISKKQAMFKLASFAMAFATVAPLSCWTWFGEPQLPKKLQK